MSTVQRRKREHGEGHISQRKDGLWQARIQIGTKDDGKPIIKAFYGRTEAAVIGKLDEYKTRFPKQNRAAVQNITVRRYMEHWLETVKKHELKPKSYDRLETTLQHQIYPHIGHIPVAALKPVDIQNLIHKLYREGYSYSTIKKTYDAINSCFKSAPIQKAGIQNPALGVTLPRQMKSPKQDIRYYTKEESDKLIETATSVYRNGEPVYRLGAVIPFTLHTGLRVGELLALKWENVDLKNKAVTITDSMVWARNRGEDAKTKLILIDQESTRTERRTLSLNDTAYRALLILNQITGKFNYVLSSKKGKPLTPKNLDALLRNVANRAGFPKEKIYGMRALRYTFASMLLMKGADLKTVSEILGHGDMTVTLNLVNRLTEDNELDPVKRIENF